MRGRPCRTGQAQDKEELLVLNQRGREGSKTYNGLGNGLADGVGLGDVTTTRDADADVKLGEVVGAGDQEGLVQLGAQDLLAEQLEGLAVDADQTVALLALGDRCIITEPVSKPTASCIFGGGIPLAPPRAPGPRVGKQPEFSLPVEVFFFPKVWTADMLTMLTIPGWWCECAGRTRIFLYREVEWDYDGFCGMDFLVSKPLAARATPSRAWSEGSMWLVARHAPQPLWRHE